MQYSIASCVVMCYVGRKSGKGTEIESMASTYLKTEFISGIPCLYGESLRTEIRAMELKLSTPKSFSDIELRPIVQDICNVLFIYIG